MAVEIGDTRALDVSEVYADSEGGFPGSAAVRVEGVEEEPSSDRNHPQQQQQPEKEEEVDTNTHETNKLKTTVATEQDKGVGMKPSLKDRVKGKIEQVGDKLRPEDATHAKNADPHPAIL